MNPLKKYLRAAVAVLIVLWHIAFGAFWNRHGRLALQHDYDKAKIEANADARRMEQSRQSRVDEAAKASVGRAAAIRADGDRARASADSLRDALRIANRAREESAAAAAQRASALGELLATSAEAHRELAQRCDRHVNDLRLLLDAWPK